MKSHFSNFVYYFAVDKNAPPPLRHPERATYYIGVYETRARVPSPHNFLSVIIWINFNLGKYSGETFCFVLLFFLLVKILICTRVG